MTQLDHSIIQQVSKSTNVSKSHVQKVIELLDEGNTIPFIARYRKEQTGSLDEVQIDAIHKQYEYATQLMETKENVTRLIDEQDKLTDELVQQINQATTLQQLDDIYRPFKQRRRTLAQQAIEKGLQPLADWLQIPDATMTHPEEYALKFVNEEVESAEEALKGAHEIIAQQVSDNAVYREFIRKYTFYNGQLVTTLKDEKKDANKVYQQYYEYAEPVNKVKLYRVLAINRAEKEDVLSVKIDVDEAPIFNYLNRNFISEELNEHQLPIVEAAVEDSYKRFIAPAIERELRNDLSDQAYSQAIDVFGDNLRSLLLQPPLNGFVVMGFDPAYRSGCKLAIVDETGRLLDIAIIYPHTSGAGAKDKAQKELISLIEKYNVDVIAIGNGTASRESEQFVAETIQKIDRKVPYLVVNEAGASVYSASPLAREEFPDLAVEERSAISIARRLQDPLAELIKIDPKSIGVGQYQHDLPQKQLTDQLDFVVNITVNQVGVDLNTASSSLLQHVSGLTKATANNIVKLRDEMGRFTNRQQLKDVKRLGAKTFEQSVGFLRITDGENPLDQTSIHPESYKVTETILDELGIGSDSIGSKEAVAVLDDQDIQTLAKDYDLGVETLEDIFDALKHPRYDIRETQPTPILRQDVLSMKDLSVGLKMQGVVRNVVDFGAFVDIGVSEDGLIHISQLSDRYINHPLDVVSVGDIVDVEIIQLDLDANRIGLKRLKTKE